VPKIHRDLQLFCRSVSAARMPVWWRGQPYGGASQAVPCIKCEFRHWTVLIEVLAEKATASPLGQSSLVGYEWRCDALWRCGGLIRLLTSGLTATLGRSYPEQAQQELKPLEKTHPAVHPTLWQRLQNTDQAARGIGRGGFW
jgi:hypothetical protein